MSERVVVTGMAGICPLGSDWPTVKSRIQSRQSSIKVFDDWGKVKGLNTRLGAPVEDFSIPSNYPRKKSVVWEGYLFWQQEPLSWQ